MCVTGATRIAEVGPSFDEVVEEVSATGARNLRMWVVDSCVEFLTIARRRRQAEPGRLVDVCADLANDDGRDAPVVHARPQRVVAINVLQDLELDGGLGGCGRGWTSAGVLRLTILATETMDEYCGGSGLAYDPVTGLYEAPAIDPVAVDSDAAIRCGIPAGRVIRSHTVETSVQALERAQFAVSDQQPIEFGAETMLRRWTNAGTINQLDARAVARLRDGGRYLIPTSTPFALCGEPGIDRSHAASATNNG